MSLRADPLSVGEPAPWFICRTNQNLTYRFHTVGGRYIVLCFFHSAADPSSQRVLKSITAHRALFDEEHLCFFGISTDPDDEKLQRVSDFSPGIRYFWDFDQAVSAQYGAFRSDGNSAGVLTYLLDTRLRVLAVLGEDIEPENYVQRLLDLLEKLPPHNPPSVAAVQAPALVVPRVFEPELCDTLIKLYDENGGRPSGTMQDVDGQTLERVDLSRKSRRDCFIKDKQLQRLCTANIRDRLLPELLKAFQFRATRIERHIIACYDASEGGHFKFHRDNMTKGTVHRRFAVSLFLNTGQYEGGMLCFREFGQQLFSAPIGSAVVFSCSLLHEATRVTHGRRYMYLPFLYDEEGARIRRKNLRFVIGDKDPRQLELVEQQLDDIIPSW